MLQEKQEIQSQQEISSHADNADNKYFNSQQQFMNSIHGAIGNLNNVCYRSVRTMSQIATNIAYKAKYSNIPFMHRKQIKLSENGEPVYLLGQKYQPEQQQQFLWKFHQIIWLSYRSEFDGKVSDAGWGCMIRVCQMVLAEALKQSFPKLHLSEIIKQFSENTPSLFSFDRICELGKISQRWTSSTQILALLRVILQSQSKYKLLIEIYSSTVSMDDLDQQGVKYPLLITINNRLGQSSIPKQYFDNIYRLLSHPKSVGMIGGIGGQAVYIVGYHQNNLILMDPHYIQTQKQGQSIHFKNKPQGIGIDKIVPSVTFCYLIKSRQEHEQWLKDMAQIFYFHSPYSSIEFDEKIAQKIYEQKHPVMNDSDDEQFQILE